jgi:citrate lyase subunit beta/citryl-CoA lyase
MPPPRPRRSVLYRLGTEPGSYADARLHPADALLFDLEDSVAPADKTAARRRLVAALGAGGFARQERLVRINALSNEWGPEDVRALAGVDIDGVMLPKAESAGELERLEALLAAAGAPAALRLWVMIETPKGVLAAAEIAAASARLAGIAIGLGDLSRGLKAYRQRAAGRLPVLHALSTVVLAARANGLAAIDSAYRDPGDAAAFRASCLESRELGFDGKAIMDPDLIAVANAAFQPSPEEIDWARRVLAEAARTPAGHAFFVDGQLMEPGYLETARDILAAGGRSA